MFRHVRAALEALESRRLLDSSGLFPADQVILTNPIPAPIPVGPLHVELTPIAGPVDDPTVLVEVPDGSGRFFVSTRAGQVRVIQGGQLLPQPLLDLTAQVVLGSERGFLGLALAPGFAAPGSDGFGRFYTHTSELIAGPADFTTSVPLGPGEGFDHQGVIAEWRIDPGNPNAVLPGSRRVIMRIDQPQGNHNGGALVFGPDDMLYIALGDGGNFNDLGPGHSPGGNAQDLTNVYGSILRINPFGRTGLTGQYAVPADNPFVGRFGLDEIYAFGFRNPFRMSFDMPTGQLLVGDVGQRSVEEVNIVSAGGNFGWPLKEGSFRFNQADASVSDNLTGLPAGLIDPVLQYDHDEGTAVIGGFVYRGSGLPDLAGQYVFADLAAPFINFGRLFVGDLSTGQIRELIVGIQPRTVGTRVLSLATDLRGEIYVLGANDSIRRIDAPVRLTSPAQPVEVLRGQQFRITWEGGTAGTIVQLWAFGPGGWRQLANAIPAAAGGFDWNTAALPHGWYAFHAWVGLPDGVFQQSFSPDWVHVVNPGNRPPQVTITQPANLQVVTLGEVFPIQWTASDPDGDTVNVSLWVFSEQTGWFQPAGAEFLPADQGRFDWDTSGLAPGFYAFAAHAWDGSALGTAASNDFIQLVVPWSLNLLLPAQPAARSGEPVTVIWDLRNPTGAQLTLDLWVASEVLGGDGWLRVAAGLNAAQEVFIWQTTGLPAGIYRLAAWLGRQNQWAFFLGDTLLSLSL